MGSLNDAEVQILLWISEHLRNHILTPFFQFITRFGDMGIFWIVVCLGLLLFARTRATGKAASFSLLINFLLTNIILKNLFCRVRPYIWSHALVTLTTRPNDFSFPSGHTAASFSVAMAIYLAGHKKWGTAALIFAFLIGISRLYLGVHYPTDVLGGAVVGIFSAWYVRIVMDRKEEDS